MLPGEPVFPPEWVEVKAALKAGHRPRVPEPVPPPPVLRYTPTPRYGGRGEDLTPPAPWPDAELDAVRRCLGGPLRGFDDPVEPVP